MKVSHIATCDLHGGAARAAYRLHSGLRRLGHDSNLFVLEKDSQDRSVIRFEPPSEKSIRARRGLRRLLLALTQKRIEAQRPHGSTSFSGDRSEHSADVLRQVPPSDILHLHWIAGFTDYSDLISRLPPAVVWTLHDMNPFTGGCHFDGGCGRYEVRCGACPQLDSSDTKDFSAQVWQRKNRAVSRVGAKCIHLVTPSRWLAGEARKSLLLGRFPVTIIPYGIDTDRFQPRDRHVARQVLGLPPEAEIVLFVAHSVGEKRKGLAQLVEALRQLERHPKLHFLAVGDGAANQELGELGKRTTAMTIGFSDDERIMSLVYSAADLFAIPSLQDNLPLAALEALACGLPTVGFHVGGLPDIVREGQTGSLTQPGDIRALCNTIAELLQNGERRASMGQASRRVAVEEFRLDVQARRYVSLYENITRGTSQDRQVLRASQITLGT